MYTCTVTCLFLGLEKNAHDGKLAFTYQRNL